MSHPLLRRSAGIVIVQTVGFAIGASLICLGVVLVQYTPDDALVGLWLFLNQPSFWLLSVVAAFLNTTDERHRLQLPAFLRSAILLVGVVSLGWLSTYIVLWSQGAVPGPAPAG